MDLLNETLSKENMPEELKKILEKVTYEQIESIKYEAIGRALTTKVNIFDTENGRIITTDLFDALLRKIISPEALSITPDVQPLFDIQNKYMGFLFYGKIRNVKKEKRNRKIKKNISTFIMVTIAFFIGLIAPFWITMAFIIFVITAGYLGYLIIYNQRW